MTKINRYLLIFIILVITSLFGYGLYNYEGSTLTYSLFSLICFLLLGIGLRQKTSYSFLFLSIFLFLGFWLKLTFHLIFNYPYIEPIGNFDSLSDSIDDVIIVSIIGLLGVISTFFLFTYFFKSMHVYIPHTDRQELYDNIFFKKIKYLLSIIIVLTISLAYINFAYSIHLIGITPKTILPFPLNALIAWLLGIGLLLIVSYIIYADLQQNRLMQFASLYIYILIAGITSIAVLSRGQYIFTTIGLFTFLYFNRKQINNFSFRPFIQLLFICGVGYFLVITSVTSLRDFYYSGFDLTSTNTYLPKYFKIFSQLVIDRWIGLEGVMAVVAYENKSFSLFWDALTSLPSIGKIDIYQYIANAHYKEMDNTKFAFATLPGMIGFLYYSNSYLIVFFGAMILTFFMMLIEFGIWSISKNSLFTSLLGVGLASGIAQFGITPINFLKWYVMIFLFLGCLKILEYVFKTYLQKKSHA